ncbi:arv1-like family [Pyrenophora seminiperda CCB06]|uniref:Protein ARV n=1 Tax=Pyrenophora seminiperda CCB06 TaxID=1302712 RepID=A0A3M7MFV2_9PLEO|nr:arv1-like family [Pyrenophora seminiperda CCB06]
MKCRGRTPFSLTRHVTNCMAVPYAHPSCHTHNADMHILPHPLCKKFADKYVEHDFVILFIDLVLIKAEVYRHLLFNRLERDDDRFDRSILRLGVLLLLFDVYLTWARIEKLPLPQHTTPYHPSPSSFSHTQTSHNTTSDATTITTNALILQSHPLGLQYLFFLLLVTLSTLSFHLPIRLLCGYNPISLPSPLRFLWQKMIPYFPHPTPLSTALLVSSCTKLFPILLIIWDYDLPSSATAVSWAVIVNNIAALEILMDCGYVRASLLVGIGAGMRTAVGWAVLRAAGLGTGWEGYAGEWMAGSSVWGWVGDLVGM